MFEGDFADTCADKFLLVSMGAEHRVEPVQPLSSLIMSREDYNELFEEKAYY